MRRLIRTILLCIVFIIQSIYADIIDKVMISGFGGQHDLDVRAAFYSGYSSYDGTEYLGEAILYSENILASFMYAQQNGYQLMIRSTTGLSTAISFSYSYPNVDLVMPAGSNSFDHVFSGDVNNSPVVITGSGIDSNVTGYNLEFFSIDPITGYNYSSYSNGYTAGQLAFIANSLTISFDSARALARIYNSEGGTLDPFSGYGKINVAEIINSTLPVELSLFEAIKLGSSVYLKWRTETEVNNYGFEIERSTPLDSYNEIDEGKLVWGKIGFVNGSGNSNSPKNYSFVDNSIDGVEKLFYRLKQIDNDGTFEYSKVEEVSFQTPIHFVLYQNYPNPFNPTTKIRYSIPPSVNASEEKTLVTLKVYDILGNEATTLVNEEKFAGNYEVLFKANNLSSGIYFYTLKTGNYSETKKLILMK
ncbi:MAG TPA: T9SS type A sorting domain-containing protein [Ignavibacteriaceae bacterium]|nr:T9SS type A sorting domain-containing protein [Ignavibacteriaceae bacterium]